MRVRDAVPVPGRELLRFAVQRVLPTAWTILVEFQAVRIVAAVLLRHIVALFAVVTCQDDYRADIFLFTSHSLLPNYRFIR